MDSNQKKIVCYASICYASMKTFYDPETSAADAVWHIMEVNLIGPGVRTDIFYDL